MFNYDELTLQEKILFQRTKSELYQESFLNDKPDMQKIDACFSVLNQFGYMDSLPEPNVSETFYSFRDNVLLKDSNTKKHSALKKRRLRRMAKVAVAFAAVLAIICTLVAAQDSVQLDIWTVLGNPTDYIYDENIDKLYNPDAESTTVIIRRIY